VTDERLDKNVQFCTFSYTQILCEGSADGEGSISDDMVVGEGFVGYDPDFDGDVRFPGHPADASSRIWDFQFKGGDLTIEDGVPSVYAGIVFKLLTILGELPQYPFQSFGSDVYKRLYDPRSGMGLRRLEDDIRVAVEEMDRVDEVLDVKATAEPGTAVVVELGVRIAGEEATMVFSAQEGII